MSETASGRLEHAIVLTALFCVVYIGVWAVRRIRPLLPRWLVAMTPAHLKHSVFAALILPPIALFIGLQVSALFESGPAGAQRQASIEEQMAATRAAPGWHVVGGELFHDGVRDEDGTRRMQKAIDEINERQTTLSWRLDDWIEQQKEALDVGFQAERTAIYRQFERGKSNADGR